MIILLRTAMDDRPEDAVGRLTCPRLVLRGRHDHLAPEAWARSLGPVVELPGAHDVPFTHPQAVSVALRRFVEG